MLGMTPTVRYTAEVARIVDLPRRVQHCPSELVSEMTEALRKAKGTQRLFPIQALALYEALIYGGLVGNIDVGEGKTLITFLIAHVLEATRYALLLPANLIEKTLREHEEYAKHWHVTPLHKIEVISYEKLGRVKYKEFLEDLNPDLIACDEGHRLKDRSAACTRVVMRFMKNHPATRFVDLSGTLMQSSVRDFGHCMRWALKEGAPVPRTESELEDWAWALDDKLSEDVRWHPGALLKFCDQVGDDLLQSARRGFQQRMLETPGVVSTLGLGQEPLPSLYIRPSEEPAYSPVTEENFARLRDPWELPDGWQVMSAADVWRHAREMALGFFYEWDPRPPQEWIEARRGWHSFVTEVLSRSRSLDSEGHIVQFVDAGTLDDGGALARWREVKGRYRINQKAVWFDNAALELCKRWMNEHPQGIVWVEHVQFGERLAALSGRKYYGAEGRAADGELLTVNVDPGPVIASIRANKEGRNLQRWSENLITALPDQADLLHQLIGRTHRRGQKADEVIVEVLLACREHASAFRHVMSGAEALRDTIGAKPKMLLADVTWPSTSDRKGARWQRGAGQASV